jgi:hypothetical protein
VLGRFSSHFRPEARGAGLWADVHHHRGAQSCQCEDGGDWDGLKYRCWGYGYIEGCSAMDPVSRVTVLLAGVVLGGFERGFLG